MEQATGPRGHRDEAVVRAKHARLDEPHIAPVTRLVDEIRALTGQPDTPYVDPTFGGVHAQVLVLVQPPTQAPVSGLVSLDDDEPVAAHLWEFYRARGLARRVCLHWPVVPWPVPADGPSGDDERAGVAAAALPWLARLVDLLPDLRLVLALGPTAQRCFTGYLLREDARLVPWLPAAHPATRLRSRRPSAWTDLGRAFDVAARVTASERLTSGG